MQQFNDNGFVFKFVVRVRFEHLFYPEVVIAAQFLPFSTVVTGFKCKERDYKQDMAIQRNAPLFLSLPFLKVLILRNKVNFILNMYLYSL